MNVRFKNFEFIPKTFTSLKGYNLSLFFKDLSSGITVGIVSLPLAMAFAIASGTPPEKGLFTAIIAGFLISFFSGSKYQIGGPTGSFIIITFHILAVNGYEGLFLATFIAGIILIILGITKAGSLIKYIPYPVTIGFTSGMAVLIFSSQIKDFFGLPIENVPVEFLSKWKLYIINFLDLNISTTFIALFTMITMIILKKLYPKLPGAIIAIILSSLIAYIFKLDIHTIGSKFGSLPHSLPAPSIHFFSFEKITVMLPQATTIAFLAIIESLMSTVVADGMTGDRHNSNTELIAQGIANIFSPVFGGLPAAGAIARTATNIKSGAFSPISGMVHALVLFCFIFFLSPLATSIPLASLSAVLVIVSWNMSEFNIFLRMFKSPKSDLYVMLITFFIMVTVDITFAVQTGVILASFLFIRRMSNVTNIEKIYNISNNYELENDIDATQNKKIPPHTELYEINGPFFFGIADILKDTLNELEKPPAIFIIRMRHVNAIDASGLHALEDFYYKCKKQKTTLILSGVQEQPMNALKKIGIDKLIGDENILTHIDTALERASKILETTFPIQNKTLIK